MKKTDRPITQDSQGDEEDFGEYNNDFLKTNSNTPAQTKPKANQQYL